MEHTLPKVVVIRAGVESAPRYITFATEPESMHGHLTAQSSDIFNTYVKIEVETAKIDTKFVHLRFTHTNKYWERASNVPGQFDNVIAVSDKPNEDTSKLSCTLFEPIDQNNGTFQFRHVQSGDHVQRSSVRFDPIVLGNTFGTSFTVIDWDTLVILPKHVAFKGDNGKYLSGRLIQGFRHLEFSSDDGYEEATAYEVTTTSIGQIRIKSLLFDSLLRRDNNNWILADTTSTLGNNTLFWPVKINDSTIALRSVANNRFCKRFTDAGRTSCLIANDVTISQAARLKVEELVLERSIYDVRFRLADARIYNEKASIAGFGSAINESAKEAELTVSIGYDDTTSYSFTNSSSISSGVTTSISTGIPKIVSGSVEISNETTQSFEWSKTVEETRRAESECRVVVPPRSWVRVSFVATQGTCSVPFSYTQRDKLASDGSFLTVKSADGIYHGVNYYSFHFEKHEVEPL